MKKFSFVLYALGLLSISSLGCGSVSEPAPEPEPRVLLDLHVFEEEGLLKAYAFATNAGKNPIYYVSGSACGIALRILDADGEPLQLHCWSGPFMPCIEIELPPGESVSSSFVFGGDICVDGNTVPLEPGSYRVFAGFLYRPDNAPGYGESREVTRERGFTWP